MNSDTRAVRGEMVVVCVMLGLIALGVWRQAPAAPRYTVSVRDEGEEIYVFDSRTGQVFITSADTVRSYGEEIWARLDPRQNAVPLKVYLDQQQNIALRQHIIKEQRAAEAALAAQTP